MIRLVYEVDPLRCPRCGGATRVVAFLTEHAVVDRIIDHLKLTFVALLVIRAHSKAPGKKPERVDPYILKRGSTVLDTARAVHKDFAEKLANARLLQEGSFSGQIVTRDEILKDEDIVELHI